MSNRRGYGGEVVGGFQGQQVRGVLTAAFQDPDQNVRLHGLKVRGGGVGVRLRVGFGVRVEARL